MVQTKMGRYWEQAKGWFFRKVWPFQTKEGRQDGSIQNASHLPKPHG